MAQDKIRNVAIIAHVDHGKTTLVDMLFRQSGLFRENEEVAERLMDSMDLERERGITIKSKNGSCSYKGYTINIIDTPGHADFGGEVERVLHMADGAVFLVDAVEGPMPQSYFVLKKAIAINLPIIVIVNKIDKQAARCEMVVEEVFDMMVKIGAPDHILDFPVIYASTKNGYATESLEKEVNRINLVLDKVIDYIPAPGGDPEGPVQMQVCSLSYSTFLGRLAIGKITSGRLKTNQDVVLATPDKILFSGRITKLYRFNVDQQVVTESAETGDIVAVAGFLDIHVGETITDKDNPIPLPTKMVDPPTISMNFIPNDSPFAGKEGQFVTSRHIKERLERELLSDVALSMEELTQQTGFKVSGRGELHLSILIEKMRREGFELAVSRPTVIYKEKDGILLEPYEELFVDVDENYMGKIIEALGPRKGVIIDVKQENGQAKMKFRIPTRGLLGYQSEFMMDTKGMGVMNYVFLEYAPFAGEINMRKDGVMVSKSNCITIAYALYNLQRRGDLFMGQGEKVYEGQIIGKYCKAGELVVNPARGKKLSNMRSVSSDEAVVLTPYVRMSLEQCLSFIDNDELVEVTPKSIRMRKIFRKETERINAVRTIG